MEILKRKSIVAMVILAALSAGWILTAKTAPAEEAQKPEAVQLNVNITLEDNLAALKGKTVTVDLAAGQEMTGTVKDVKNGLLHLEKLVGKEFYDALVVIDDISALEVRVRR